MLLLSFAIDCYIICNADAPCALLQNLIHPFLEYILGPYKPKWQPQELISSKGTVEHGQQTGFLVQSDRPVSMPGIKFGEKP